MTTSKKCIIAALSYFLILPASLLADQSFKKDVVTEQLDCVSRQLQHQGQTGWGDICYSGGDYDDGKTRKQKIADALEMEEHVRSKDEDKEPMIAKTPPPPEERETQASTDSFKGEPASEDIQSYKKTLKEAAPKKKMLTGTLSRRKSLQKFDFGFETYSSRYREPSISVKFDGQYYGAYAGYTIRLSENKPIKSIGDILSDENKVNMFRIEGRAAAASVEYDGSVVASGISDHVYELRGLAGYDVPLDEQTRFTPYAGIGYRYLFDTFSSAGPGGYDREQQYIYLPLGIEYEHQFDTQWTMGGTLEYDILLRGDNKTHLEDLGGSTLNFIQREGRGVRVSVKAIHETDKIDFTAEPFFRYWRIEDSTVDSGFYEPQNNTRELGVKLGIRY